MYGLLFHPKPVSYYREQDEDKGKRAREGECESGRKKDPLLGEPVPRSFSVAGGKGWVIKKQKIKDKWIGAKK
jgi:hypothetical protein